MQTTEMIAAKTISRLSIALLATCAGYAVAQGSCTEASVAWRVPMPGPFARNRPALGPNGEIGYQTSQLVVIEPNGSERYRLDVPLSISDSLCDFDDAGNVYANSLNGIVSYDSDGALRWTLDPAGNNYSGHAGPTVGPDGNIYFVDISFPGYGMGSVSPDGQLRWNTPGWGDADSNQPRNEIVFTNGLAVGGSPMIPDDCDGDCLASGLMAFDYDGNYAWTAHTTTPFQATVTTGGDLFLPILPNDTRIVDGNDGSVSPVEPLTLNRTGKVVAVGPDGTGYVVTFYRTLTGISPDGESSTLTTLDAIMGSPAISPDGSTLVVGEADSLLPSPNRITGIDTSDGSILWSIDLPMEGDYQLAATGWPRFSEDGLHVYVPVSAGNDSYIYAINLCTGSGTDCLADTNGDGNLDPSDFTAWINAFNNNAPECDQNADGACTPADFTAWINNYNQGC